MSDNSADVMASTSFEMIGIARLSELIAATDLAVENADKIFLQRCEDLAWEVVRDGRHLERYLLDGFDQRAAEGLVDDLHSGEVANAIDQCFELEDGPLSWRQIHRECYAEIVALTSTQEETR